MTTHVIASSHAGPHLSATSSSTSSGSAVVGQHFRVGKKIGEGSFGVVFEGVNVLTHQPVAIKFEPRKSEAPQLRDEYRSYRILNGSPGIPTVHYFGQEGLHNVLVIDLFGPNLEDLFDMCGRKFSIKTVCILAKQMISRVQAIHDKNLIYRDIKPDNFLIGAPGTRNANLVHIIDFGMAKHYRDPRSHVHIPYRERKSLSGTARYMSINTHLGREQSRRDDLESLGHVFMYFLRGGLPWQGLKAATNKQKYEKIGQKKESTPISELCEGFPEEFSIYMNYVRKLGFEEHPDYEFLRSLFNKVLEGRGETDDGQFDWMALNGGRGWEAGNTPSSLLAQAHAQAQSTPHRSRRHRTEKERERDRERYKERERERNADTSTSTPGGATGVGISMSPLVLPTPAAKKRDRTDRLAIGVGSGSDGTPTTTGTGTQLGAITSASMNPIAPASRRVSAITPGMSATTMNMSVERLNTTANGPAGSNANVAATPTSIHPYASVLHTTPSGANAMTNGSTPHGLRTPSNPHKPLPTPFPPNTGPEGSESRGYRPVEGMRLEGSERDRGTRLRTDVDDIPRKGIFALCCR